MVSGNQKLGLIGVALATWLFIWLVNVPPSATQVTLLRDSVESIASLPFQSYPLPVNLARWQDPTNSGDYFSQVKVTTVGYLVWSHPIQVYIEPGSGTEQTQRWIKSVSLAVQDWSVYLPLKVVEQPDTADIAIVHSRSPIQVSSTGILQRVRAAETSYQLYIKDALILAHRCTIKLNPNQTDFYLQASARHELGHALGIWGHSPVATDVMYYAQVRNPPPISARDLNTLKRVYQQPTRLGW